MAKYTPYRLNTLIYKLSGGRLMNKTPGGDLKILLLTTTGRKSGKPRTHPVMYYQDAEDFVITASNSGADKPPLWYLNLRANPQASIQVGNLTQPVVACVASGEERTRLWNAMAERQPVFNAFESFTQRALPVIVLHPR
jgi:deazaflavin-dependent oxidoreductase (nitroreductase family)